MDLKGLIKKDLIQVNLDCRDQDELFQIMCSNIVQKGYAKESFYTGIKEREASFPTGIGLTNYNIAIPHTDPIHTQVPFISVVTLKKPVKFKMMEDFNQEGEIKLIFMMGLDKPESSIQVLTQLVAIFQNEDMINRIINASTTAELEEILQQIE
ncbi:PTS sugar transporter subunit IIA [Alkaliphilus crotonatoxidans]